MADFLVLIQPLVFVVISPQNAPKRAKLRILVAFNVKFLLYTITDYVFILLKMRPSAIDFPQGSWGHLVCDFLSVFERAKLLLLLLQVGSRASLVDSCSHSTGAGVLLSLPSTSDTQGTRKGKEQGKIRINERKGIRKDNRPPYYGLLVSTSLIPRAQTTMYCF